MADKINRRKLLKNLGLSAGVLSFTGVSGIIASELSSKTELSRPYSISGKIKHSVCRWCYQDIPLQEFAKACAKMGIQALIF